MKTIIKNINRKTDNRFIYAIGVFCLLSICMSQFPEAQQKQTVDKNEIIIASNISNTNSSTSLNYTK